MRFQTIRHRSIQSILTLGLGVAAVSIVGAGCTDPARQRSERAVGTLNDTRDTLADGRKQIDHVLVEISSLEAKPADLNKPFSDYQATVKTIENEAETVRARVQDMRLRSAQYSTAWSTDASQNINNPQLREKATERAQMAKERFDAIDRDAQAVRAAYDPFITELHDLDVYLANDLSYGAIDSAKPMFGTVRSSAATLQEKIDQLQRSLDAEANRLSPTTAPMP